MEPKHNHKLNKPEKQLTSGCACTAVEPEREFVQVIGTAALSNCSLVRLKQPSVEQKGDKMRKGKLFRIFAYLMSIAFNRDATVALPTVCNNRAARRNGILNEGFQGNRTHVRKCRQTNSPDSFEPLVFDGDSNGYFSLCSASALPRFFFLQCKSRPPVRSPSIDHVQDGPLHGAAYEATPRFVW